MSCSCSAGFCTRHRSEPTESLAEGTENARQPVFIGATSLPQSIKHPFQVQELGPGAVLD